MASARIWGPYLEVINNTGLVTPYGNKTTDAPRTVSLTGEQFYTSSVIADNYTRVVLWQDGDAGVAAFDIMLFESNLAVLVEFAIDRAGTPTYGVIEVTANNPIILTSDDMVNAVLADGSATTMDQIDQIACKNNVADDAGDATVHLTLWD